MVVKPLDLELIPNNVKCSLKVEENTAVCYDMKLEYVSQYEPKNKNILKYKIPGSTQS